MRRSHPLLDQLPGSIQVEPPPLRSTPWGHTGGATPLRSTPWGHTGGATSLRSTPWGHTGGATPLRSTPWEHTGGATPLRSTPWGHTGGATPLRSTPREAYKTRATISVADPGDAAGGHPATMGPNSFVFAYVSTEKHPRQKLAPPPMGNPGFAAAYPCAVNPFEIHILQISSSTRCSFYRHIKAWKKMRKISKQKNQEFKAKYQYKKMF